MQENSSSLFIKHKRISDAVLTALIYICAVFAIGLVVGIVGYVFVRGIGSINWTFLTTVKSSKNGSFGIGFTTILN